jgi:hypothetical protein
VVFVLPAEGAKAVSVIRKDDTPCPFCGEIHERGPVGEVGTAFEGIEFKVCPAIPEGFIYNDHEYERGPRGQLLRLGDDD